jgi:hypothetical protein
LQPNGAFAAHDQSLGCVEQLKELGAAETAKFYIVDLPLHRRKLSEKSVSVVRDLKLNAAPIRRVDRFVNEPLLQEFVGNYRYKSATQVQMLGNTLDVYVTLLSGQMPDRN